MHCILVRGAEFHLIPVTIWGRNGVAVTFA